jgi:hypothetical protein
VLVNSLSLSLSLCRARVQDLLFVRMHFARRLPLPAAFPFAAVAAHPRFAAFVEADSNSNSDMGTSINRNQGAGGIEAEDDNDDDDDDLEKWYRADYDEADDDADAPSSSSSSSSSLFSFTSFASAAASLAFSGGADISSSSADPDFSRARTAFLSGEARGFWRRPIGSFGALVESQLEAAVALIGDAFERGAGAYVRAGHVADDGSDSSSDSDSDGLTAASDRSADIFASDFSSSFSGRWSLGAWLARTAVGGLLPSPLFAAPLTALRSQLGALAGRLHPRLFAEVWRRAAVRVDAFVYEVQNALRQRCDSISIIDTSQLLNLCAANHSLSSTSKDFRVEHQRYSLFYFSFATKI